MANYNQQMPIGQQTPIQYPYYNNLITNSPYDNYMGRNVTQNYQNQYLKCRPVASKE